MENNKIDIEMADMVGKTYFKIATWNNQEFNSPKEKQEALKHVCAEIIQTILEDTFLQLDGIAETGTKTLSSDSSKETTNETPGEAGQMFQVNEDAILKALKDKKQ